MKLRNEKPAVGWTARHRRGARGRGPGAWGLVYGGLWLQLSLLAALVYVPRADTQSLTLLAAWVVGAACVALYVAHGWAAFHDFIVGMDLRQRWVFEVLLVIGCLVGPYFAMDRLLPDALLWSATAMLLLSVTPGLLRRGLIYSMLGAWFAARGLEGPWHFALLIAFAAGWLFALGASHVGFVGEAFTLRGWWMPRLVLRNTLAVAIPSAAVAAMVYFSTPPRELPPLQEGRPLESMLQQTPGQGGQVDPQAMVEALKHLAIAVGVMVVAMILLHLLMRRFKAGKMELGIDLLPGQVGRPHAGAAAQPGSGLDGRRGEIVRLWTRWAAAQPLPEGRDPSDTAREFAEHVELHQLEAGPESELQRERRAATELLEQAHYAEEEPSEAMVNTMRDLTRRAIERRDTARKQREQTKPGHPVG